MALPRWFSVFVLVALTVVSLVTFAVVLTVLYTAKTPHSSTIVTPTEDPHDVLKTESCSVPLNQTVLLPLTCEIMYYTGELVNTSLINIGRCSNKQCKTDSGSCSGHDGMRCCCQTLAYQNMEYVCGTNPPRVYDKITTDCGCMVCNISVSFVGVVVDETKRPLPLVSVNVGNIDQVFTDRYGMFGFIVSGLLSQVNVSVSVASYAPYRSVVPVTLGSTNFILVQLLPVEVFAFASNEPVLISMISLTLYSSIQEFVSQSSSAKGDSLVIFPAGYFSDVSVDDLQFEIVPVELDSNDVLFLLKENFTTLISTASAIATKLVKRQASSQEQQIISVIAFGSMQVLDQFSENVTAQSSMEVSIVTSVDEDVYALREVESFDLFIFNKEMASFIKQDIPTHVGLSDGVFVITYNISNVTLPLTYIIGRTVTPTCYTIVRVFNMEDVQEQPVIFVTRQSNNKREVSLFRGMSNQCVPIPCTGDVMIRVDNFFNTYHPPEILQAITVANSSTAQTQFYSAIDDCLSFGLQSNDSDHFFAVAEVEGVSGFPPPTDTLDDLEGVDIETYCFIQVEATYCNSKTVMVSLTNSFEEQNQMISRVKVINEEDGRIEVLDQQGSGTDCQRSSKVCIEYICNPISQVNISASHCFAENCLPDSYTFCYPVISDGDDSLFHNRTGGVDLASPFVTFSSSVDKPGIYSSDDSRDIAFYKCELGGTVALKFECAKNL